MCFGGPRQFEHGLGQAFANLAGRGAFDSLVVAEPVDSPGNGEIHENSVSRVLPFPKSFHKPLEYLI